jgi:hypothetical protein
MCEEIRVDDSNPKKKSQIYVDSISRSVRELIKIVSEEKWISVKDGKPDGRTGAYASRYWCIAERLNKGKWEKIFYCDEADEYYTESHVYSMYGVGYDEILYVSI